MFVKTKKYLSPKVDLTENNDFGPERIQLISIDAGGVGFDDEVDDEDISMSYDQYTKLCMWEGIFGKKIHKNRKKSLFSIGKKRLFDLEKTCERCGRDIKELWNNHHGLCKDCAGILQTNDYNKNKKIPWRDYSLEAQEKNLYDRSVFNLFNSK